MNKLDLDNELEATKVSKYPLNPVNPTYKSTQRPQNSAKRLTLPEKLMILADKGAGSSVRIARKHGCSPSTVSAIWNNEKLALRQKELAVIKEGLADECLLVMDKSRKRVADTLPKASVGQAATVFGIFFDKYRLLNNESTQNHSAHVWLDLVNAVPVDDNFDII